MSDMPLNKAFITILLFFATFLSSQLCNAQGKKESRTRAAIPYPHKVIAPPGMVYVKGGVTTINYDQSTTDTNSARKVSVTSFFMDKTEVTNQMYREFTNWVIDSIAITAYLKDDQYFMDFKPGENVTPEPTAPPAPDNNAMVPITDSGKTPLMDTSGLSGNPRPAPAPATTPAVTTTTPTVNPAPAFSAVDSTGRRRKINWSKVDHDKIFSEANRSKLSALLDENGNIKKDQYMYTWKHLKVVSIAGHQGKPQYVTETISIYPNENVWAEDLTNAQTDLYVENYFKVPPFDDYPVVGVSWLQSRAYCNWRSNNAGAYYNMPDYMKYYRFIYTLPSEAQWVYAAQGFYDMIYASKYNNRDTLDTVNLYNLPPDSMVVTHNFITDTTATATTPPPPSPQALQDSINADKNAIKQQRIAEYEKKLKRAENGNMYVMDYIKMLNFLQNGYNTGNEGPIIDSTAIHRDINGMLTNFKQDEGDYWEDGAALTVPVMSFAPNEFGLYNMEGNVAEWVMDAYSPSAFSFVSDINPQLMYDADSTDADVMKRKVVRGGSFISNAKSLSPFYRDMELQNVSHCFLGFRCVVEAPEIITPNTATRNRTQRGKRTPGKLSGVRLPEIH